MIRFDEKNLLMLFILLALVNLFSGGFDIQNTVLMLPGLIIALTLHEFAHAKTAVILGDNTPEYQGRVNINPLSHMDPVGTICLLLGGFGWGKPVQINPVHFKHPEKDSAKVALAGPVMNFILSIVSAVIYALVFVLAAKTNNYYVDNGTAYLNPTWEIISIIFLYSMYLNIGLALFNLLPFPPLDGSKIYRAILKGKAKEFLYTLENYSWIIIMILFVTHIASYIITPISNFICSNVLFPIIDAIVNVAFK